MKSITLLLPDEADEAAVLAALRELQQKTLFYLESDLEALPGPAASPAEWEQRLREAEDSDDLSVEEARAYLGL